MSIFSDISDFIFGGTDTSAQDAQAAANAEARRAIDASTQQAREDVLNIFPQASQDRNLGFQAALDVLGQTIPQQLQTFQGGNVGAQQNLLAGLPQFQNAILGGSIDFSALQPQTIGFDAGFAQQQLPEFGGLVTPRTTQQQEQAAQQSLATLLAGAGNFSGGEAGDTGFDPSFSGQNLSSAQQFDLAISIQDLLGSPAARALSFVVPGGSLATGLLGLSNITASQALGGDTGFTDFFSGDAREAAAALGLTSADFAVGGQFTPNTNAVQTRDVDRFGSPRAEDRDSGDTGGEGADDSDIGSRDRGLGAASGA